MIKSVPWQRRPATAHPAQEGPATGDYVCSETALYRVEQVVGEHGLVEDCRTGRLIDMPLSVLAALRTIKHGRASQRS